MKTARFNARKSFTFTGPLHGNTWGVLEDVVKVEIRDAIAEVLQRHGFSLEKSDSLIRMETKEAFR